MRLFLIYKYLIKKQKLNYYIKYKVFKLLQYTKYLKYWRKYLKPKHIENYKEYLKDKYNYFKVKDKNKYRLLKFYKISFYKYKLNLLKIINALNFLNKSTDLKTYNLIKLRTKIKTLYNYKFKLKNKSQFKLLSYILFYFIKTSQYNSKRYGRIVKYFTHYRYYISKREFRKRYIRCYFLPKYKFKGRAFKYLLVKNAIYLQFLKRLLKNENNYKRPTTYTCVKVASSRFSGRCKKQNPPFIQLTEDFCLTQ